MVGFAALDDPLFVKSPAKPLYDLYKFRTGKDGTNPPIVPTVPTLSAARAIGAQTHADTPCDVQCHSGVPPRSTRLTYVRRSLSA